MAVGIGTMMFHPRLKGADEDAARGREMEMAALASPGLTPIP